MTHNPCYSVNIFRKCPERIMFACLERRTILPRTLPAMQRLCHKEVMQNPALMT